MTRNDFGEGQAVEVRYPLTREQQAGDRNCWPWLSGWIVEKVGADEYRVCVVDNRVAELEDGSRPPAGTPDDELYWPCCYRDSSELRPA